MKTKLILSALLIIVAISTNAQNLIAVQQGKGPTFYTDLPTAVNNAAVGDTVYIPGGSFPAITINKKLILVGVGHNPDSTSVTARTIISNITLSSGADNSFITGILISLVTVNSNLTGVTFSRCNIPTVTQSAQFTTANFTFEENIINLFSLGNCVNSGIYNNVITGGVGTLNNCTINNNIFVQASLVSATGSSFQNNVFEPSLVVGYTNDIFYNNINTGVNGAPNDGYFNQGNNNYLTSTPLNSIFPTFDPTVIAATDGVYKIDFNLPSTSPYKNAGKDGTDIGIYGGAFPWKPGSIPFNPHFQSLKIAPQTDSSGNLKVQITVAAQNN